MISKRLRVLTPLSVSLLLGSFCVGAEEQSDAHALHEKNCISCHGTDVYTREDRKVTSYEGLGRQVRRCETALGLRWFDEEIDDVSAYLNSKYYRLMPD